MGVLLLLFVAFLVNCSVLMLIDCGIKTGKLDLEELAEHLLGRRGYYFTLVFMFLFGYGAQVAYLVVIGDTIPMAAQLLWPGSFFCSRLNTLLFLSTLFVLPLSSFRKLSTLAWTSMISIAGDVVVIIIVLIACTTLKAKQDEHFEASDIDGVNSSLFAGVGTMAFAFVCQHNSFMVFRSLAKPTAKEWRKVADISVSFAWLVCTAFGLIGFFSFYPYVRGDLLNNFSVDSTSIAFARLILARTMVLTYPMECYVTRHCVLSICAKVQDDLQQERRLTGHAGDPSSVVGFMKIIVMRMSGEAPHPSTHTSSKNHNHHLINNGHRSRSRPLSKNNTAYRQVSEEESSKEDAPAAVMFVENNVLMQYDTSTLDGAEGGGAHHSGSASPVSPKNSHAAAASEAYESVNPIFSGSVDDSGYSSQARHDSKDRADYNHPHHRFSIHIPTDTSTDYPIDVDAVGSPVNDAHISATDKASFCMHMSVTLILWGSSLSIALAFKKLGVVASLTGPLM
jgi:amino acid permease